MRFAWWLATIGELRATRLRRPSRPHDVLRLHASLLGSRATTLGLLAGLQLLVTPVVQSLHDPGVGAEAVLGIALWKLAPKELLNGAPAGHLGMSVTATVAVITAWMLLVLGLGAWRTITRDA
jgi:hypothetical protein